MPSIAMRALKLLLGEDFEPPKLPLVRSKRAKLTSEDLIALESKSGVSVFGTAPADVRREFFCTDEKTWIWYEEWTRGHKQHESRTIKYELTAKGVLKTQSGARYEYISGDELRNFGLALRLYYDKVAREVYQRDPATGKKLLQ